MNRILFVDDRLELRQLFAQLCECYGLSAEVFDGGAPALERLKQNGPQETFDVIVTDIEMPGMDGIALIQAVRSMGIALPIMATTGSIDEGLAQRALDAGANDVLFKPFDPHDLFGRMEVLVKRPQQPPSREPSSDSASAETEKKGFGGPLRLGDFEPYDVY